MAAPAVLLIVKVSLLLGAALAAAWLTHTSPARSRHRLWSGVFAAVLLLPALTAALPVLHVPVLTWAATPPDRGDVTRLAAREPESSSRMDFQPEAAEIHPGRISAAPPPSSESPSFSFAQILAFIWVGGVIAAFIALAVALLRVEYLSRTATPVLALDWTSAAASIGDRLGLRSPVRLLSSPRVITPMAGGLIRPTVYVPASAMAWTPEHREVVLAHEIAHLAGRDPLRQLLSRVALSVYWFHPLAWLATRQAAMAREQACDETVLALGTRPSTYARVLLDFADGAPISSAHLAALPIVQRSLLERRLMAILNDDARPATRRVALVSAALAALTLSVAAAQPAQVDRLAGGVEQNASGVVSPGVVGGVPGGVAGGVPGGVTAPGVAGGVPGGIAGGVPGGVRRGVDGVVGAFRELTDQPGGSACDWRGTGPFNGSTSSSRVGGRDFIHERVGRQGYDLVIQKTIDGLRVCAFAEGLSNDNDFPSPGTWTRQSRHVVLETQEPNLTRRMEITGGTMSYSVNGQQRPVDDTSREWADRLTELLDAVWELRLLHGRESSLRGQISSILGQRSSLQGQISSLRGRVSSMQGEISSWQGRESSLRGEISSIQGQLSSMQGQISSEQGQISSLQSRRWDASEAERARIAEQVDRHRARIREIEKRIADFDVDARIREVEKRIEQSKIDENIREVEKRLRAFDIEPRVREIEKQIVQLEVEKRVAEIEREILGLEVERKARDLEAQIDRALKQLREIGV